MELIYDRKFKISTLKIVEISQSSAKQRMGRAGRTGPGFCFRLYSSDSFRNRQHGKIP
jgi:HrpA-like RNA helicase